MQPVLLAEPICMAMSEIETKKEPGVTINLDMGDVPDDTMVMTNGEMLQHLLRCLCSNAAKFTPEGSITINTQLIPDGADTSKKLLRISVTDTGIGIPEGEEEHIFERFVKLNNFIPGTGLGLSLARLLAGHLGGRVYLDKTASTQGSCFALEIPFIN